MWDLWGYGDGTLRVADADVSEVKHVGAKHHLCKDSASIEESTIEPK